MSEALTPRRSEVGRIFGNLSLLLTGKAGAGVISLGYLVIAARSLGATDYGVLILIHGYATLIGGLVAFSGWHGLARYGAQALRDDDHGRLLRIIRFMSLVELALGVLAILVSAALAPLVGPHLGWSPRATGFAVVYSLSIVATVRSTPLGLLQIASRFDLISAHHLISPAVRLIGSVAVWALGGGLIGFLMVWLIAAIAEGAAMWALGLFVLRRMRLRERLRGSPRGVRRENAGLLRFITITNADITLAELAPRLAPLAVAWILGPAAAGVLSLAQRASIILQQPALLLGQASYAVFAKLASASDFAGLRHTALRSAAISTALSLPILALLALFSKQILSLLGGHSFATGASLLLLTAAARALYMGVPPLSAALTAIGRPSLSIIVNLAANFLLFPLLPVFLWRYGLDGAGWHALLQSVVSTAALIALLLIFALPRAIAEARG